MKTTRLPPHRCPACLHDLDCASDPEGKNVPEPGSLTVCMYCVALLEFDADMQLQRVSDRTLATLSAADMSYLNRMRIGVQLLVRGKLP